MGKNFPLITNLKAHPHLFEKTLKLIEKSFHYKSPHSFKEDFAPLVQSANHHNCFVIIDENENVLAHIGAKDAHLQVSNKKFPVTMLGGIAVDEKFRGEGYFQALLNDVLSEKRSDTSFFLLWSDLEKLYNKFGFYLCGHQFELDKTTAAASFEKTNFHLLSPSQKDQIKALYEKSFSGIYVTLERTDSDWENIRHITSADLYMRTSNDEITDYFFMNKGQDLPEIIYEYGTRKDLSALVQEISGFGKVWMGSELSPTENLQFQFFLAPGELKHFTELISELTQNRILVRNINPMKQEVYFDFNDEVLALEVPEFLKGIFGPGTFEELETKPLFISGLDSI